jgi:hypothetical protein
MVLVFRPTDSVRCTACHGCLDFHSQRFSSSCCDDASVFWDRQAQRLWVSGEVYEPLRNSQKAMRKVA